MALDDNSSDGESSDEENPEAMSDKKAWLAWARALTWDAAVADDRDCFSVDALPDDDHRRNTAELIADLQTLRQLSETPVAKDFRFPEGLGLLDGAPVAAVAASSPRTAARGARCSAAAWRRRASGRRRRRRCRCRSRTSLCGRGAPPRSAPTLRSTRR